MKIRPETIENRWDILYRDYPEVYEEFASVPKSPPVNLIERFSLEGKVIVDVGSGAGDSTFAYAGHASEVIGIELERAMMEIAEKRAADLGIRNVRFIQGDARSIPLPDASADALLGATLAINPPAGFKDLAREAERVVRPGGKAILLNIAPGWYGGELASVIGDDGKWDTEVDDVLAECGFDFEDIDQDQEYGSIEKITATYGFIFGKKAIDYLKEHKKTSIRWKLRIRHKSIGK